MKAAGRGQRLPPGAAARHPPRPAALHCRHSPASVAAAACRNPSHPRQRRLPRRLRRAHQAAGPPPLHTPACAWHPCTAASVPAAPRRQRAQLAAVGRHRRRCHRPHTPPLPHQSAAAVWLAPLRTLRHHQRQHPHLHPSQKRRLRRNLPPPSLRHPHRLLLLPVPTAGAKGTRMRSWASKPMTPTTTAKGLSPMRWWQPQRYRTTSATWSPTRTPSRVTASRGSAAAARVAWCRPPAAAAAAVAAAVGLAWMRWRTTTLPRCRGRGRRRDCLPLRRSGSSAAAAVAARRVAEAAVVGPVVAARQAATMAWMAAPPAAVAAAPALRARRLRACARSQRAACGGPTRLGHQACGVLGRVATWTRLPPPLPAPARHLTVPARWLPPRRRRARWVPLPCRLPLRWRPSSRRRW